SADDHAVNGKEFGGLRSFYNIDVSGDRVRGVFLLHISEDPNVICADRAAIAQQVARARFDQAFIRDVGKDKTFDAHETRIAGESHRQRTCIRAREYLNTKRK